MNGYYLSANFNDFLNLLEKTCSNKEKLNIFISIITWQDGDYFEDLCNEDGGVIQEHLTFFKEKTLGKKIDGFSNLKMILDAAQKMPYLSSKNGNYKLFYDIHILIDRHYFCYNIYLNKYFYRIQNIFQYIFGVLVYPEWRNNTPEAWA